MQETILRLAIKIQSFVREDEGQDLIEYALVVALIALAATTGMGTLANGINKAFSSLATKFNSDV